MIEGSNFKLLWFYIGPMYQHESLLIYSNWLEPSMSIDVVHGISVQNGYKRMEKFST